MRLRKHHLGAVLLVLFLGVVQAAPDDTGTGSVSGEATVSGKVTANLTPQEMSAKAAGLIQDMEKAQTRMTELQLLSRKGKDVIKLNCVNDKFVPLKQLINIAESARGVVDSGSGDREFAFAQVTLASERIATLLSEAEGCVGEKDIYVGATKVLVRAPRIVDDPTTQVPFELQWVEIERTTYASPYL